MYEWLKALHVIAVIAWMAGLLYLPRLFVYHAGAKAGSETSETFKIMERRLLKAIMTPAMIVVWVVGLYLMWDAGFLRSGWMHAKLTLVLVLSGLHGWFAGMVRAFAEDRNQRPARFYRIVNEGPTLIMVAVVILVVIKPF
jgi:protoporphyrinogen IX oxidase